MKQKKVKKCISVLLFCVIFVLSGITSYAENCRSHLNLPVNQFVKGNKEQSGTYEWISLQDGNPMPENSVEGSYRFTMTGKEAQHIIYICYANAGIYSYQVKQIPGSEDGWKYDEKTYKVTVYIKNGDDGELYSEVIVTDDNGVKKSEICFVNEYFMQDFTDVTVQTGDYSNVSKDLATMLVAASVMVGCLLWRKKE